MDCKCEQLLNKIVEALDELGSDLDGIGQKEESRLIWKIRDALGDIIQIKIINLDRKKVIVNG